MYFYIYKTVCSHSGFCGVGSVNERDGTALRHLPHRLLLDKKTRHALFTVS